MIKVDDDYGDIVRDLKSAVNKEFESKISQGLENEYM